MAYDANKINDALTSILVGDRLSADPEAADSYNVVSPLMQKRGRPSFVARPGSGLTTRCLCRAVGAGGCRLAAA